MNNWRYFVLIDIDRIEEYLKDITTEVYDVKSILNEPDEQVLQDRHLITYHAHRTWFDEDPSKGSKSIAIPADYNPIFRT